MTFDPDRFIRGKAAITRGGDRATFSHFNNTQWPITANVWNDKGKKTHCYHMDGMWSHVIKTHRDFVDMEGE